MVRNPLLSKVWQVRFLCMTPNNPIVPPGHSQDFLLLDVANEFNLEVAKFICLGLATVAYDRFYAELTADGQVSSLFGFEKTTLELSNPRTILQPAVVRAEILASVRTFLRRNPLNSDAGPLEEFTFEYLSQYIDDHQPIADDLLRMHLEETEGFLKLPVTMWEPV